MVEKYELDVPIIQVYSPYSYHCSAAIVMNRKGKEVLIKALQEGKKEVIIDAFVEDGEGFNLGVFVLPEDEIREKIQDPYMHEWGDKTLIDPRERTDIKKMHETSAQNVEVAPVALTHEDASIK